MNPFWIVKLHPSHRRDNKVATADNTAYRNEEDAVDKAKYYAGKNRQRYVVLKSVRCFGPLAETVEIPINDVVED